MSDETNLEGQSFRNEALTGSGTITPDGEYTDPLPDPTEVRGLGARRTSGGRLLPDLPSTEVDDRLRVESKQDSAKPTARKSAGTSK